MGKRQPFIIGGSLFSTKEALRIDIRRRIALYEDREPFSAEDEQFFLDLLTHHPRATIKMGCGVMGFFVARNPVYTNTQCLYLVRTDGSTTDWSWTECLQPTPHRHKIRHACRVLLEPQMFGLKQIFFGGMGEVVPCPITGHPMTFTTAHVDHIPPLTFEKLFTDFVQQEHLDLASVLLSSEGLDNSYQDTLADTGLATRWLAYHNAFAQLRVISARANLSEVKRGWDRAQ